MQIICSMSKVTAIPNPLVKNFILNWNNNKVIYDNNILDLYRNKFVSWISNSKYNNLHGLELYKDISYTNGITDAFDQYYLIQKKKRFRFFKGEYEYHQRSFQHDFNWAYIEDDDIKNGDSVILSVPFYGDGKINPLLTDEFLTYCDDKSIPVCLDFSYYPLARNIDINLNHRCIQLITFSLSKVFDGMENVRVGLRMVNDFRQIEDGITYSNQRQLINRFGAGLGYDLMNNFDINYSWENFGKKYTEVCKDNNLTETDCLLFGIDINGNRVCVSNILI
jgi:hypothetical protein